MLPMLKRPAQKDLLDVSMGTFLDGKPALLDLPSEHILLGGTTGSGKSATINAIINGWCDQNVEFYGIDLKNGVELSQWGTRFTQIVTNVTEVTSLLAQTRTIVDSRYEEMNKHGLRMWQQELGPWLIVIVDELAEMSTLPATMLINALNKPATDKDSKTEIARAKDALKWRLDLLASLAAIARAAGVIIVAATQYPTAEIVGNALRSNLSGRICLRQTAPEGYDLMLEGGYRHLQGMISRPGEAYIQNLAGCHQPRLFRSHLLSS